MRYAEAIDLLIARGNEVQGIHLGLHRIRSVLHALGNPQLRFPAVHIAGTNGKGSVAAFTAGILHQAGYRTGLYTSPHLVQVEERIQIGGRRISCRQLARLLSHVAETESILLQVGNLDRRLTYFELMTACAFLHFAEQTIDVAVVEVGLGGALDATNVVVPAVSVITGISYDHQELLGGTLREIAREKAGIIKEGTPVVSGCRQREVRDVIRRAARRTSAPLYEIGRRFRIERSGQALRARFSVKTPLGWIRRLLPGLAGRHQARNAALATVAVMQLDRFPVTAAEIRRGLAKTRWPGRLEEFRKPSRTIVDGAHNEEGAAALGAYLRQLNAGDIDLVFAVLKDKDISGMVNRLFPTARRIHLAPLSNKRSADPWMVFALATRFGRRIRIYPDSKAALEAAWRESGRSGTVVVAGSLYLVGEILPLLRRRS